MDETDSGDSLVDGRKIERSRRQGLPRLEPDQRADKCLVYVGECLEISLGMTGGNAGIARAWG